MVVGSDVAAAVKAVAVVAAAAGFRFLNLFFFHSPGHLDFGCNGSTIGNSHVVVVKTDSNSWKT